ncbi:hypothetical protein MTP99_015643 [Tenebrio molitor]|nr:hypothetical protein MTP99_015643 [Tenebrio molitor]CAH1374263.1 unnamed protein product [Tenebrio molitor]
MAKLQLRLSTKSRLVAIKIWNFVLQSKHEKLTFTCFNLFDINETLFCTILGAVATFSFIIIQFGMTFEK